MTLDDDGNLEFSKEPHEVYTIPDDHIFMWGIRIWKCFDDEGKLKIYWHIDGDITPADIAGVLELVKASLINQQIQEWNRDDE